MPFEVLPLNLDIEQLQAQVQFFIESFPKVGQGPNFQGWSVWSSDGDYKDGWQAGYLAIDNHKGNIDPEKVKAIGLRPIREYRKPTQVCTDYLKEVMEKIDGLGLFPCRARIACLPADGQSVWHRDGSDGCYAVRLHVPLITNDQCFFQYEDEKFHLPADGNAYLLRVDKLHQIVNYGNTDRYHLFMNVYDTRKISKNYQFDVEKKTWFQPQI